MTTKGHKTEIPAIIPQGLLFDRIQLTFAFYRGVRRTTNRNKMTWVTPLFPELNHRFHQKNLMEVIQARTTNKDVVFKRFVREPRLCFNGG